MNNLEKFKRSFFEFAKEDLKRTKNEIELELVSNTIEDMLRSMFPLIVKGNDYFELWNKIEKTVNEIGNKRGYTNYLKK